MFSHSDITSLLAQRSISDRLPWSSADPDAVEQFYRSVCSDVSSTTAALSRIDWEPGGYRSYIDAWFYRDSLEFKVDKPIRYGNEYKGLVVLLSRFSPYFVFMEQEQRWHRYGGSSYLPACSKVDQISTEAVATLAVQVQEVLESHGLIRARKSELAVALPEGTHVPTMLHEGVFTVFDALFYWAD